MLYFARVITLLALIMLPAYAFADLSPLVGDVLPESSVPGMDATKTPYGAVEDDLNSYMLGSVHVGVVFVEGLTGGEDWLTPAEIDGGMVTDRRSYCVTEIQAAMNWWAARNPDAGLSFVVDSRTVNVAQDPIEQSHTGAWLPEAVVALGFGELFPGLRACANDSRETSGTDWAFIIFVVDSLVDGDGRFTDQYFAFTFMNSFGQSVLSVMTYDNDGYGVANMDAVTAHETGHIFGALDEYYPCACVNEAGYLLVANENCADGCILSEDSIMKSPITAFGGEAVDVYARGQIGWTDTDADGIPDIIDTEPIVTADPVESPSSFLFTTGGLAEVVPMPTINPSYNTCTINTVAAVEYRIEDGPWLQATPFDGDFDSPQEDYSLVAEVEAAGIYQLEIRAVNSEGTAGLPVITTLDAVTDVGDVTPRVPTLSAAPNPFNPRVRISWWLPAEQQANLVIYDLRGRPVRMIHSGYAAEGNHVSLWDGTDESGRKLPSGVYRAVLVSGSLTVSKGVSLVR